MHTMICSMGKGYLSGMEPFLWGALVINVVASIYLCRYLVRRFKKKRLWFLYPVIFYILWVTMLWGFVGICYLVFYLYDLVLATGSHINFVELEPYAWGACVFGGVASIFLCRYLVRRFKKKKLWFLTPIFSFGLWMSGFWLFTGACSLVIYLGGL